MSSVLGHFFLLWWITSTTLCNGQMLDLQNTYLYSKIVDITLCAQRCDYWSLPCIMQVDPKYKHTHPVTGVVGVLRHTRNATWPRNNYQGMAKSYTTRRTTKSGKGKEWFSPYGFEVSKGLVIPWVWTSKAVRQHFSVVLCYLSFVNFAMVTGN